MLRKALFSPLRLGDLSSVSPSSLTWPLLLYGILTAAIVSSSVVSNVFLTFAPRILAPVSVYTKQERFRVGQLLNSALVSSSDTEAESFVGPHNGFQDGHDGFQTDASVVSQPFREWPIDIDLNEFILDTDVAELFRQY